jgi:hypothetical protein
MKLSYKILITLQETLEIKQDITLSSLRKS